MFDPAAAPPCVIMWEPPCPICAFWIGPHKHMLRSTGEIGSLILRCSPRERAIQEAVRRLALGE